MTAHGQHQSARSYPGIGRMSWSLSFAIQAFAMALLQCASPQASAQSAPVTGSLVDVAEIAGFNALGASRSPGESGVL